MDRKAYATDPTDKQWLMLEPLLPTAKPGGRPRSINLREIVNAMLYLVRTGCPWRSLPHDLPPWSTVWTYFRHWRDDGTLDRPHDALRTRVAAECRLSGQPIGQDGRKRGARGFDADKKVQGRTHHLGVDTLGLIHGVVVHPANVQGRDGATVVLTPRVGRLTSLGAHLGGW